MSQRIEKVGEDRQFYPPKTAVIRMQEDRNDFLSIAYAIITSKKSDALGKILERSGVERALVLKTFKG